MSLVTDGRRRGAVSGRRTAQVTTVLAVGVAMLLCCICMSLASCKPSQSKMAQAYAEWYNPVGEKEGRWAQDAGALADVAGQLTRGATVAQLEQKMGELEEFTKQTRTWMQGHPVPEIIKRGDPTAYGLANECRELFLDCYDHRLEFLARARDALAAATSGDARAYTKAMNDQMAAGLPLVEAMNKIVEKMGTISQRLGLAPSP